MCEFMFIIIMLLKIEFNIMKNYVINEIIIKNITSSISPMTILSMIMTNNNSTNTKIEKSTFEPNIILPKYQDTNGLLYDSDEENELSDDIKID